MISSRQVVELIEDEIRTMTDVKMKSTLQEIVNKIEVLEGMEMDKMYQDFIVNEEAERKRKEEVRKKAEQEFARAFKS